MLPAALLLSSPLHRLRAHSVHDAYKETSSFSVAVSNHQKSSLLVQRGFGASTILAAHVYYVKTIHLSF